jgi:ATP-dependent Clp protease ATP-binding subunit ClpA
VPTSQRIADLAGEVTQAPTAGGALRKVRELRRELDAFEREQVARALSEGATFATIARELGVSRQAVHRRFRSLTADEEPLQTSLDTRRVLRLAREEASAHAAAPSGSHVIVATLRAADLPAAETLRRAGATLDRARTQVEAATLRTPMFRRSPENAAQEIRSLLAGPARVARARGERLIEVEHVLLGVLGDDAGDASRTLGALGVDARKVEADLLKLLDSNKPVDDKS